MSFLFRFFRAKIGKIIRITKTYVENYVFHDTKKSHTPRISNLEVKNYDIRFRQEGTTMAALCFYRASAAMLSGILSSDIALGTIIKIIKAFVASRRVVRSVYPFLNLSPYQLKICNNHFYFFDKRPPTRSPKTAGPNKPKK